MRASADTLGDVLREHSRESELHDTLADGSSRCYACGHECLVKPGRFGVCRVRYNEGGTLYAPFGYVAGVQCDPIEKKPFFHAYPGARALSFGMLGCDFHCGYCQNWVTSQALRDPAAGIAPQQTSADAIVAAALRLGAEVVTSTYNEPLITSEWAVAVFREAVEQGLTCSFVSNGNATPRVLDYLEPYVRLYKVDLKTFQDKQYRKLGGRLEPVLDTIRALVARGIWTEIVTLTVPGYNDSDEELRDIAEFVASVSADIPWHVTAFHKDYKMTDPANTDVGTLLRAWEIGKRAGLRYVYAGNLPGSVGDTESTFCPGCDGKLVDRRGFQILSDRMRQGECPDCGTRIAGVWREVANAVERTDTVQPPVKSNSTPSAASRSSRSSL
ncbi:AmmeMemoRadiSam system radical SAM enzyme [Candidatus Poribacteria bacterium]|jgi:pyruvate formate lyase activating enzyme|nr:AmmeMemoRadiSam system radical SAM enzyme [Candidatus Poribacteria bacterium]MBT5532770.1 AmmeMemoRadiSam system radical SAM enzyme [Candidatus Poribacteria bacterium]MBT5711136.1 AmmeMemoRadiSam system radical SAM enzyme [Candidatus Poribacteria bacterium]MBT7101772.1 AmmeMemoRadiSam system radical SAM enzyme [Candidatus Poribacteria bacterium]MBT7808926.1 AmmeMemoRadiSam system radical SAM enzyme [Candidatus Poribacteria bacterium]